MNYITNIHSKLCYILMILLYNIPLLLGGLIYLAFRPIDLIMFDWVKLIRLQYIIGIYRVEIHDFYYILPYYVIYSLPTGLWAYSFVTTISIIPIAKNYRKYMFALSLVIILGSEIGQYFGILSGFFDLADLTTNIVFVILAFTTIKIKEWVK